jgi:hypothetical protein
VNSQNGETGPCGHSLPRKGGQLSEATTTRRPGWIHTATFKAKIDSERADQ